MTRVKAILADVCEERGVGIKDLLGRSRGSKHIVQARHAAIRRVAEHVGWDPANCSNKQWSSVTIGRLFNRHHTTILSVLGRLS